MGVGIRSDSVVLVQSVLLDLKEPVASRPNALKLPYP